MSQKEGGRLTPAKYTLKWDGGIYTVRGLYIKMQPPMTLNAIHHRMQTQRRKYGVIDWDRAFEVPAGSIIQVGVKEYDRREPESRGKEALCFTCIHAGGYAPHLGHSCTWVRDLTLPEEAKAVKGGGDSLKIIECRNYQHMRKAGKPAAEKAPSKKTTEKEWEKEMASKRNDMDRIYPTSQLADSLGLGADAAAAPPKEEAKPLEENTRPALQAEALHWGMYLNRRSVCSPIVMEPVDIAALLMIHEALNLQPDQKKDWAVSLTRMKDLIRVLETAGE